MYLKNKKYLTLVVLLLVGFFANGQVTTQSPYSKFGLGNVKGSLLPQFRAMGGISTAVNTPNGYSNINVLNPASYAGIHMTSIDAGMSGSITTLKRGSLSESGFNSTLSHVALAFPTTPKSAFSIGILPFTELGYDFKNTTRIDTLNFDQVYRGEGGLTKAYIGYGYQIIDNLRIGVNIEYVFGNLIESRSVEPVNQINALNSRIENKNSVYGLNLSYGAQYDVKINKKVKMILGYSGSSSSSIKSKQTYVVSRYTKDAQGNENPVLSGDTTAFVQNNAKGLKLPLMHNFGISFQQDYKWMVGADFRMGKWSSLTINDVNQGLQDTYGFSVGGQYTPNIGAISGYFNRVDYRLGFAYDKTAVRISNTDINQMSASFGFGFPFASISRFAFSKLNFTTEIGKRGTLQSNLVKENFVNFHIGVTLNDTWFRRFKFD